MIELIFALLRVEPHARPPLEKVLSHSWVNQKAVDSAKLFSPVEIRQVDSMKQVSNFSDEPIHMLTEYNLSQTDTKVLGNN